MVVANKVICMDLWWNWQVENQAIDRYDYDLLLLMKGRIERVKRSPSPLIELSSRIQLRKESLHCKSRRKRWLRRRWEMKLQGESGG
jgi:hypothetical protein